MATAPGWRPGTDHGARLELLSSMPKKNSNDMIDKAAAKATSTSKRTGNAMKGGARKVARTIKRAGRAVGKKLGA
jgi:hypothetical protein